ncbi:MAG: hypothetical protein ACI89U_000504 [Gammaproteobacteria bacterium]|jgi:hypothetical protein
MDNATIISTGISLLLGMSFGALAMFYSTKEKLKKYQQANSSRRIGMLEQVAQHVGKVSHTFSKYSSLVNEIGPQAEGISVRQGAELEDLSSDLVSVYEEISIAESKLLLLGEKRLEKAMKLYTAKMAQYRKKIYPGRYSNSEEANTIKKDIISMKDQFYNILSERYDNNNASQ